MSATLRVTILFLFLLLAGVVQAADLKSGDEGLTIVAYRGKLRGVSARGARTEGKVEAKPTTTGPPEGFSDRVQSTLADFLPLFQGSIQSISTSEDKKTLTIRFNPVATGSRGQLGVAAAIAEPGLFRPIEDGIVDAVRESQRKRFLDGVDDFSDVALSVAYGYQHRGGSWDSPRGVPTMWGRNYELYRELVDALLLSGIKAASDGADSRLRAIDAKIGNFYADLEGDDVGETTMGSARRQLGDRFPGFLELLEQEASAINSFLDALAPVHDIASLIDNQPQLTLTGSHRARDAIVGQDATTISLGVELGATNLNSVIREYRWLKVNRPADATPFTALKRVLARGGVVAENRFSLTVTYVHENRYSHRFGYVEDVTDPTTQVSVAVPHEVVLDLPASDAWHGKLQWGRLLASQVTLERADDTPPPRLDVAAEFVNVSKDPKRTKNRLVLSGTVTIPISTTATLPVTLVYADKPEFLGDRKKQVGAHIGLNYKLVRTGTGD